mmetsp:Transcript_15493/g.60589  ORF Transcript_15493/g.60589 Transcript_15493/m.60589 type:complete len:285 (+) Transcript_15493:44-898(+)
MASVAELWASEERLALKERRARYCCGDSFVKLEEVEAWPRYYALRRLLGRGAFPPEGDLPVDEAASAVASKVALWQGNITRLEVDAVQNAANESLLGGGGIDGAIHRGAGPSLLKETSQLGGCPTGDAKISRGYNLPAKYVVHTVGPVGEKADLLTSCYKRTLDVAKENGIRSIALCGVSTGVYGYPVQAACPVALLAVRDWLLSGDNAEAVDLVIFVQFLVREVEAYEHFMPLVFPPPKVTAGSPRAPPAPALPAALGPSPPKKQKREEPPELVAAKAAAASE